MSKQKKNSRKNLTTHETVILATAILQLISATIRLINDLLSSG